MNLEKARQIAVNEINKYPTLVAQGWSFQFDRAKKRLGLTRFYDKTITISHYMTSAATEAEFMQTLYHELAHALLPHSVGHGPQWKSLAKKLGYKGQRTSANPYQTAMTGTRMRAQVASSGSRTAKTLAMGDVLVLPNKVEVTVISMNETFVKAQNKADNKIWTIGAKDAIYLVK